MSAADELRSCADAVEQACAAFASGLFDGGPAALESAAEHLARLRPELDGSASADALAEAWRLRRSVHRAGALLENAATYHRGWNARIAVRTAGYEPGGLPGEIVRPGRVWVEA